uniref:Uncharacterized protein n=1 Tax=Setaria viridis TaxID=4556 RepID=A0A4U6V7V0_SETVI|nr:hypothetical protein SEVIR_3G047750v2 [Setaria viridis]
MKSDPDLLILLILSHLYPAATPVSSLLPSASTRPRGPVAAPAASPQAGRPRLHAAASSLLAAVSTSTRVPWPCAAGRRLPADDTPPSRRTPSPPLLPPPLSVDPSLFEDEIHRVSLTSVESTRLQPANP